MFAMTPENYPKSEKDDHVYFLVLCMPLSKTETAQETSKIKGTKNDEGTLVLRSTDTKQSLQVLPCEWFLWKNAEVVLD